MKRLIIVVPVCLVIFSLVWMRYKPTVVSGSPKEMSVSLISKKNDVPEKNQLIIAYVEEYGREIAPEYYPVVCTEFLIKVIDHFSPLTKQAKKDIRIITEDDLSDLVEAEADVIKGVQVAFTKAGIGEAIPVERVSAGDFVQFWDTEFSSAWGHCGIVHQITPGEFISVYSSHPITSGYGIQQFPWPKKVFFARLK